MYEDFVMYRQLDSGGTGQYGKEPFRSCCAPLIARSSIYLNRMGFYQSGAASFALAAGKANFVVVSSKAFASTSAAARHVAPTFCPIISIHFSRCPKESNTNHCRSRQRCFFSSLQVHHHQIAASWWESTTR